MAAEEEGGACPKCGAEDAVEFDMVQGMSACMACGAVLDDEQLVSAADFDKGGGRQGTFVREGDTGEMAGALALPSAGTGLAVARSMKQTASQSKTKAQAREIAARLQLQPAIVEQAQHLVEQAAEELTERWRRDHLAAAATYAACRLNSLPVTLADLSAATHLPHHILGARYVALCRKLGLHPPLLLASDLLPRSLDRATGEAVRSGALTAAQVAGLRRDARAMLDWMREQKERQAYPLAAVGVALVLAAEMNTVTLSRAHVCSSLHLRKSTLETHLGETRARLLELAAFLPYSASITAKNVGSHARTIMQLAALVGRPRGAEASTGGAAAAGGAQQAGGVEAPGQQQQEGRQGQQQQQSQRGEEETPAEGRAAGAGNAGQQQQQQQQSLVTSSPGQRKRPRLQQEAGASAGRPPAAAQAAAG